ncbi:MAG: hypothetical protein HY508_10400 [Acidobacteria bacterium]|nr:hypothetical protein [Acidobacteriota bacterium]
MKIYLYYLIENLEIESPAGDDTKLLGNHALWRFTKNNLSTTVRNALEMLYEALQRQPGWEPWGWVDYWYLKRELEDHQSISQVARLFGSLNGPQPQNNSWSQVFTENLEQTIAGDDGWPWEDDFHYDFLSYLFLYDAQELRVPLVLVELQDNSKSLYGRAHKCPFRMEPSHLGDSTEAILEPPFDYLISKSDFASFQQFIYRVSEASKLRSGSPPLEFLQVGWKRFHRLVEQFHDMLRYGGIKEGGRYFGDTKDLRDSLLFDSIVVMEALFGEKYEVKDKLASRVATAIAKPPDRLKVFQEIRNIFGARNDLVHGNPGSLKNLFEKFNMTPNALLWCVRRSVLACLCLIEAIGQDSSFMNGVRILQGPDAVSEKPKKLKNTIGTLLDFALFDGELDKLLQTKTQALITCARPPS